jgi:hypothetical protein
MNTQEIIEYLNSLIETDSTLNIQTRVVLAETIEKLRNPLSREELFQLILVLVSLLGTNLIKT